MLTVRFQSEPLERIFSVIKRCCLLREDPHVPQDPQDLIIREGFDIDENVKIDENYESFHQILENE